MQKAGAAGIGAGRGQITLNRVLNDSPDAPVIEIFRDGQLG